MQIFPIGLLVLAIWFVLAWRSADRALAFSVMMFPFGMLAVMRLPIGGMTPLASHVLAALSVSLLAVGTIARGRRMSGAIPVASIPLFLFGLYAVFASVVLVRFFTGDFLVFSFSRNSSGILLSNDFAARLTPLAPSSGNISQTAYLLLSIAFFFAIHDVVRRRGVEYVVSTLRVAAILNILLGTVDLLEFDSVLIPFRTADYNLLDVQQVAGVSRIVGGFSEASAFGSASAAFAAFFLTLGHMTDRAIDLAIGMLSVVLSLLSLSSTAFLCLGVIAVFFLARALRPFVMSINQRDAFVLIVLAGVVLAAAALLYLSQWLGDLPAQILDKLLFSKAESTSGLERGAMARYGLITFVETNGFGAGVGSVRANGYVSALLAATGLPGLILLLWFVKAAFIDGDVGRETKAHALKRSAQAAALVSFAGASTSSFSVDPGLMVMLFASISIATRSSRPVDALAPA